ncbi:hypothetical protein U1Q18_030139 [Sarracenia purpurea var. burkii]
MDSSRISLRPFKVSDAEDFLSWAKDERVTHYLRWGPITTTEDAVKYLKEVAIPHPWRRSICVDDRSIGYVSIWPEPGNDRHRANLGYAISADFWGKGITTAALKMAISSVFMEVPCLVRVEGLVEEENKRSQRVLEKVGFKKEGFLRKYGFNRGEIKDMFVYSFLSTDKII